MATFELDAAPTFPEHSTVFAYARTLWSGQAPHAGDLPRGVVIAAEAEVGERGKAELTGLADETEYYVGSFVAGAWRWKTIRTPAPAGGTGSPGPPGVGLPAGGATGYIPKKKSGADFDVIWVPETGGLSKAEAEALIAEEAALRTAAAALKAPLASPALTGTPTVPTAAPGTNTTQAASTAFTTAAVAAEAALRFAADQLQRKVVTLGIAVTGNLTLDLNEGRVFKGTTTGATALQTPLHIPADGTTSYFELELIGESAITFPGIAGWKFGGEPPQQPGLNRYGFLCDDGANVYGVGTEGLPSSVVKAIGTPTDKQVPTWNAGEEQWVPATPAAPGLSEAAVNARIAAEATALSLVKRQAMAVISSGVVIPTSPLNMGYRITKVGSYALPPSANITRDGDVLLVENATTGLVTLTGNVGGNTVSMPMGPGDVATFVGDLTVAEALSISAFWHLASFTGAQPAAFTGLTLVPSKVEAGTGIAHGAQLGPGASRVFLRGVVKVIEGKSVAATVKFATLPSSLMFPTSTVMKTAHNAATGAPIPFTINTAGELKPVAELTSTTEVSFDDTSPFSIG